MTLSQRRFSCGHRAARDRDGRGRFCKPYQREAVCSRCAELRGGAPTRFDLVIVAKNGTVEKEVHDEHAQEVPVEEDDA
jgi:hypothetical protein